MMASKVVSVVKAPYSVRAAVNFNTCLVSLIGEIRNKLNGYSNT